MVIELDRLYEQLDLVELDAELAGEAGALAETHDLRGYDASAPGCGPQGRRRRPGLRCR